MDKFQNKDTQQPPGSPRQKFTWWWIYAVLFVFLLVPYYINTSSGSKEISWQQFEKDILSRKAVERIQVVNNETAEVYIKKEFANDPYFKEVMQKAIGKGVNEGPHYIFTIGSVESFERKMEEGQKNFSPA